MALQELAQGIVSLSQARTAHERRIAYLENEIRELKKILSGLLGSVQEGSPEGEIEDNGDALDPLNGRGALPMSVAEVNFPGQSRKPSLPPDHEHQGVYSISVGNGCGSGESADAGAIQGVNKISFIESRESAVFLSYETKIDPAVDGNPFVPDRNNLFGPLNPENAGEGEDVVNGLDIYIGHYPVPTGPTASPNTTSQSKAVCVSACGDSTLVPKEMVRESDGAPWIHFAGRTNIDCQGHVHIMNDYSMQVSLAAFEEPDEIECCGSEETIVLSDVSIACIATGNPGQVDRSFEYQLTFDRVKFKLPEDTWSIASDPTPGSGQIVVLTGITAEAREDCNCSYAISVTKDVALKTSSGSSGYTGTVDVVCDVYCDEDTLTVSSLTLTFSNGALQSVGACA